MKSKLILIVLSVLALTNVSSTSIKEALSTDNQTPSTVKIERIQDRTSTVVFDDGKEYGYKFTIPSGWYPLAMPPTTDEVEDLKDIIEEHDLPLDDEWINRNILSTNEGLELVVVNLDPNHYQNNSPDGLLIFSTQIPESTPNWFLIFTTQISNSVEGINTADTKKIGNQYVRIIEFSFFYKEGEEEKNSSGKMLLFVRNSKLFMFAGATQNDEWLANVNSAMDEIYSTLEFN